MKKSNLKVVKSCAGKRGNGGCAFEWTIIDNVPQINAIKKAA